MFGKWSCFALVSCAFSASTIAECPSAILAADIDVFPSAKSVPENLLRFYIYFPRQMSMNLEASDIKLFDVDGREVMQVFVPMRFELWSSDRRRLTLLLDPGRVKTGLIAHETLGRALVSGERYTLEIPDSLTDSEGCALGEGASYSFKVTAADEEPPSPDSWQIDVPEAATKSMLSIDLGSPHDHLSMAYRIRILNPDGDPVAGKISLAENESVWTFQPREVWTSSAYRITVDPRLEDLAGNRPGRLFDRVANSEIEDRVEELMFFPR
ncbi:MAG: hypothetical protein AAF768_05545 [Pseudomonadota bacterium]